MDYTKMLKKLVDDNDGIISTKMVTELGIPRTYLSELIKKGMLERYKRGIYISTQSNDDKMYCFQMRFSQATFSHESALFLHQYIEKMPKQPIVTVKTGTNTKNLVNNGARVHSIRQDLYTLGETEIKTRYGRNVRTYNIERSICDIIRNRSRVDSEIIVSTVKKYNDSPEKDFSRLITYAEELKVAKILNYYLEFLQ
ncbi:MAG: transcriptional regulator [Lachnospiraceae bacterium]|jgi:predicted transcriptional regulator of viral defense system|nr:transcriptional regulator [Lachnospiraceae bacterium]